jgi:OPA family glycerol-3-phosphate transporter-like MFS transporter
VRKLKWRRNTFRPGPKGIFLITYITYAIFYFARLNFSVALTSIGFDLHYSKLTLGIISGAFSICYAFGQFVNGQLADRFGAKRIILMGLVISAIMNILFGYVDLFILLVIVWGGNGYAQSTGWPSSVKIISNWFRSNIRPIGSLFGSCFLVGSLISLPILGYVIASNGWRTAFFAPAILLFFMAVIFFFYVRDKPDEFVKNPIVNSPKTIFSLKTVLFSKKLVAIASAYMLLQFVRDGFTLWAPSFLFETYRLSLESASYVAAIIPLGGIVGSVISGRIIRTRNLERTTAYFIFFLSFVLLVFYNYASYNLQIGITLLFLLGFTLYGPIILLSTVIPMEHEDSYNVASIAGFIDGMGYIGLIIVEPFVGWIVDIQRWGGALAFWFSCSLIAAILVGFLSWNDLKRNRLK